jgi:hypothetical protein
MSKNFNKDGRSSFEVKIIILFLDRKTKTKKEIYRALALPPDSAIKGNRSSMFSRLSSAEVIVYNEKKHHWVQGPRFYERMVELFKEANTQFVERILPTQNEYSNNFQEFLDTPL